MLDIKKQKIPSSPGCYKFKNEAGKIIYIGKAANLRGRVLSYWRKSASHTPAKYSMMKRIKSVEWIETDTEIEALLLEANLIKKYQPAYNVDLKDDKRFLYIKVSTEDEIPGVFATRKIGKSGRYFGPFTSARAVRETLKATRKIWPYCAERKKKPKPCFYAQIGRCLGPCGGLVDIPEYKKKVVKPIILFLEGKKKKIIKDLESRIKELESRGAARVARRQGARDELSQVKFQLINMNKVLEHANIISMGEKYSSDVVELAKILGLSRVPERIEGYDISNIFGKEAVGSMVVFKNGEPETPEYRKFKIKIKNELGDVSMLREVLERRFKHASEGKAGEAKPLRFDSNRRGLASDFWPEPDLIIIDGGKAQLNAALRVLKKNNLEIPVLAVSKGRGLRSAQAPDKVFFPGESKPLELPLSSPALHIIKRARDEAHRFAVNYHRKLRSKNLAL